MESAVSSTSPSAKAAMRADIRTRRAARLRESAPGTVAHVSVQQDALSARVRARVEALDPAAVVAYASLPGEPSLDAVLEHLIAAGVPVLLPVTLKGQPLRLGPATAPLDALPRGTWDIREPATHLPVAEALAGIAGPPASPVLVLAPGLAFDAAGARLGNGGGFYDRTFGPRGVLAEPDHSHLCERLVIEGVCWDDEVQERLPAEPWDLIVGAVLTDARTLEADPLE